MQLTGGHDVQLAESYLVLTVPLLVFWCQMLYSCWKHSSNFFQMSAGEARVVLCTAAGEGIPADEGLAPGAGARFVLDAITCNSSQCVPFISFCQIQVSPAFCYLVFHCFAPSSLLKYTPKSDYQGDILIDQFF